MRVGVHGATGRMGRLVLAEVLAARDLALHAAVTHPASSLVGVDAGELAGAGATGTTLSADPAVLRGADVIVDFSHPTALPALLTAVDGTALISGTTGLDRAGEALIADYATRAPVLRADNFSTGVAVLRHVVRQAAALLPEWDAEIVEAHHSRKVDSPSGTARALIQSIEAGRGAPAHHVHGREGIVGARPTGDIGVHALRLGDVIGEHTVSFGGSGEVVHLGHTAVERRVFAVGAVRAARWLAGRPTGGYRFAQVVGLEPTPSA
ncbi:MAG: 4-hydroxy-tetrahydrodipicolinate reductase [Proteobacteria bacterium]|nr:4-hydroxy-tetrahydrodipicolinate reductase [Pseudomonadota bacterium]